MKDVAAVAANGDTILFNVQAAQEEERKQEQLSKAWEEEALLPEMAVCHQQQLLVLVLL